MKLIEQHVATDSSLRELTTKIDQFNDLAREKAIVAASEARAATSDLSSRVAVLEWRAKLWGGAIGLLSGVMATVIIDLVTRELSR